MRRTRDAEAELNLPPGFRFHPTDDELVVHYLCRKVAYQCLPVPIIAEVDLYKYDPWELPGIWFCSFVFVLHIRCLMKCFLCMLILVLLCFDL